ncbi:unnamed protein product [Sphacelaria rigidula]
MASALARAVTGGGRIMLEASARSTRAPVSSAKRRMGLKTNPYIEEWMGKREITEKTFKFTPKITLGLIVAVGLFPMWCHHQIKSGMEYTDEKKHGKKRVYY